MGWYYKDGEQEIGPVDKTRLQALIKSKQINAQTLVRSENSEKWQTLLEATKSKSRQPVTRPDTPPQVQQNRPKASVQVGGIQQAQTDVSAVCSQCGRSFPKDQVVKFDDQVICAACKPMFVQRLREGVSTSVDQFQYAGFWIRVGAKLIDTIILAVVQQVIKLIGVLITGIPLEPVSGDSVDPDALALTIGLGFFSFIINIAYVTFFLGRFGATPGKMACGLRVVTPDGGSISYWRAFARFWAEIVSWMILFIGYIMVAFDSQKRALHDHICSTRVIRK